MDITKLIQTIVVTVGLIVLAGAILVQSGAYLKNTAIAECLKSGQVEFQRDGQTLRTPDMYWYTYCMNQMGYQVKK